MKKSFTLFVAVLLTASVFAQSPEKMGYQAVIRNSSDVLVTDTQVGMQISILQGSADGSPVYVETQTPTTNANGLVSVEIGDGTVLNGDFSTIDWANGPYYIKTETDPAGSTSYTITGTSQLLSVPYALYAETAETVSGETDPVFMAWDKDYNDLTGIPTIPADLSDISDNTSLLFSGNYNDLSNLPTLFDGAFSSLTGTPTTITGYGITDAFDGKYSSLTGTPANLSDFTNDVGYLTDYTVTESDVTAHEAVIKVTESQISDLGTYIETENDPIYTSSQAASITATDITNLSNLSGTNTGDQEISTLATKTELGDSTAQVRSEMPDVSGFITGETDPVFEAWDKDYNDLTNTPATITTSQAEAIAANTAKVGYTDALVSANADVVANTAKVGYTDALVSSNANVVANTAKVGVSPGTAAGQMQYWDGTAWVTVAVTENEGAALQMIGGVPTWVGGTPSTPNVTNPTTGAIWMDRNLGASQAATSSTDYLAYGDLYQWGRASDGHQTIVWTSSTTSDGAEQANETATLSSTDDPGHGNFILAPDSPNDWRNPQNDNLWQGVSGTNNPCPSGYRLPTEAEWEAERQSWGSNNSVGAFGSPLKLPMAGRRYNSNGSLLDVGSLGYYWSSNVGGTYSRRLRFYSSDAIMSGYLRAHGGSVRCLKD